MPLPENKYVSTIWSHSSVRLQHDCVSTVKLKKKQYNYAMVGWTLLLALDQLIVLYCFVTLQYFS